MLRTIVNLRGTECGSNKIALLCHGAMSGKHDMVTVNKSSVVSLVKSKQQKAKRK